MNFGGDTNVQSITTPHSIHLAAILVQIQLQGCFPRGIFFIYGVEDKKTGKNSKKSFFIITYDEGENHMVNLMQKHN